MFLKQSDILEAAEALEYTLVVLVVLVLIVEGIPNLSKERVDLCFGIVCPVGLLAFAVGGSSFGHQWPPLRTRFGVISNSWP